MMHRRKPANTINTGDVVRVNVAKSPEDTPVMAWREVIGKELSPALPGQDRGKYIALYLRIEPGEPMRYIVKAECPIRFSN